MYRKTSNISRTKSHNLKSIDSACSCLRKIYWSQVFSGECRCTKASDAELWLFFNCAWTNSWANKQDAGDLRRHFAHYDVTVMRCLNFNNSYELFIKYLNYMHWRHALKNMKCLDARPISVVHVHLTWYKLSRPLINFIHALISCRGSNFRGANNHSRHPRGTDESQSNTRHQHTNKLPPLTLLIRLECFHGTWTK